MPSKSLPTKPSQFLSLSLSYIHCDFTKIPSDSTNSWNLPTTKMKKSGLLAASVAAAVSVSSSAHTSHQDGVVDESRRRENSTPAATSSSSSSEKFAPRFDGLRFIETLITAHR